MPTNNNNKTYDDIILGLMPMHPHITTITTINIIIAYMRSILLISYTYAREVLHYAVKEPRTEYYYQRR